MMKFTQLPADTFQEMQLNAGLILSAFDPMTGTLDRASIVGATSGGMTFEAKPSFTDFGDDIDNCPANMKELKRLDGYEATMSGTFVTLTPKGAASLVGAADVDAYDKTRVVPRSDLTDADFADVWWVGDYSAKNGSKNGGFVAIHLMDALNTDGIKIKADDKKKGEFDFNFTAHYSMADPSRVPFEIYVKAGTDETA